MKSPTIEKGVPIPGYGHMRRQIYGDLIRDMQAQDSFLVDQHPGRARSPKRFEHNVYCLIYRAAADVQAKVLIRKTRFGIRVWRLK